MYFDIITEITSLQKSRTQNNQFCERKLDLRLSSTAFKAKAKRYT